MAEQLYFKCTFEGCTHRPFSYFTINEHMAYHVKKKYETTEHFNLRCTQCNAFFMGNVHAEDHAKMKKHLVVANALKIFGKSDGTRRWVDMMKKWVRRPSEEEMSYMENQGFGCTPAYDRGRTPANDRGRTPGFERRRTPGFERGRTPGFERGRTPGMDRGRTPGFDRGRTPANERRRSPGRGRTPGFDRGRTPGFDRGRTPGFDRGRTPGFDRGRTPGFDRGRNPVDRGRIPENDRGRSHGIAPAIRRPRSPPNVEKVYRPSSPEILLSDDGGYSPGTVRSFVSSRSATPRSARVSPCRNNDYEYGSFNAFRPHPKPGYNREYDQEKHRPERRMRSELDLHNDRHSFNAGRQMFQGSYSTGELGPRDNGDDARCSTSTSNLDGRLHQEQTIPQTSSDGHRVEKNGGNSRENNENVPSDRRAIRSGAPPVFSPQKKFVSADPHPYATPRLLPNQESVKTRDNTVLSTCPAIRTILINQDDSPKVEQSPEVIILENDATTTKKSQKKSTKRGKSKSKKGRIEKYGPAPPPEDDGELSPLVITPNFKASQSEEKAKKDKVKKSIRKRHLVSDSEEEDDGKKKKKKKKRDRSRRRRSSSGSSSHDSRSPSRHRKRSRTRSRRRSRDSSTDSRSRRGRHSSKHEKRRSRSKDLSFSRSPRSN